MKKERTISPDKWRFRPGDSKGAQAGDYFNALLTRRIREIPAEEAVKALGLKNTRGLKRILSKIIGASLVENGHIRLSRIVSFDPNIRTSQTPDHSGVHNSRGANTKKMWTT